MSYRHPDELAALDDEALAAAQDKAAEDAWWEMQAAHDAEIERLAGIIRDGEGRPLAVGARVVVYGSELAGSGEVIELGEWDGDVDDDGRSIGIPPTVRVRFPEGVEAFNCAMTGLHETRCEDLSLIEGPAPC